MSMLRHGAEVMSACACNCRGSMALTIGWRLVLLRWMYVRCVAVPCYMSREWTLRWFRDGMRRRPGLVLLVILRIIGCWTRVPARARAIDAAEKDSRHPVVLPPRAKCRYLSADNAQVPGGIQLVTEQMNGVERWPNAEDDHPATHRRCPNKEAPTRPKTSCGWVRLAGRRRQIGRVRNRRDCQIFS